MRYFFVYLILLFLLFIPVFYYRFINVSIVPRIIFLRIFNFVEFIFISLMFFTVIKNITFKKIIPVLWVIYSAFALYDYYTSDTKTFSYLPLVMECFFLLIFIFFFFYEKMNITSNVIIYKTSIFWIAVAYIIYCGGNFFLFLYAKNSMQNESFKIQYNIIYGTFTILKNLFLCIAIVIKEIDNTKSNIQTIADDVWEIPAEYKKPKP